MHSKIIFLGTAGESLVYGKQIRASGGIIIQTDNLQCIIDPGPGSITMAAQFGINLRDTDAIFVTHNHINHCNDVNAIINEIIPINPTILKKKQAYAANRGIKLAVFLGRLCEIIHLILVSCLTPSDSKNS